MTPNISLNIVNNRPNSFVSTLSEAYTVANSLFATGKEPPPEGAQRGETEPAALMNATLAISIRKASLSELYFPQDTYTAFIAAGYAPYLIEWLGPTIQEDNGEVLYSATPPQQSTFYGKRVPMGFTYYSEWAGILSDLLTGLPNAKWYLTYDGSIVRR